MSVETRTSRYFHRECRDGVSVVSFDDIQIGPDARVPLYGLVKDEGPTLILLDFRNVWALSSCALGILANLQQKVDAGGGRLKLCCLNSNVIQLFRLTKFDRIFDIYDNQEEALRDFRGPRTTEHAVGPG